MVSDERSALSAVVQSFRRQRRVLLIVWAVILVAAVAYAFLARPVYRAELVMAQAESESDGDFMSSINNQFGALASVAGLNFGSDDKIQTHLALLESRDFTRSFIVSNDLLPILYEDDWDADKADWKDGRELSMWEVLEDFDRDIRSVRYDAGSGLVRLRMHWHSPELAAQWANDMGTQFNSMIRQRAIREAQDSIRYLQDELGKNSILGVEQSIYGLIESQIGKIMLANVRKDYAFQVIDPAIAPAIDKPLRPNRPLVIAIGLVLGFVLAGLVAVSADAIRNA